MEPRISLITLGVQDLNRSKEFYQKGLGFVPSSFESEEVVFFKTSGVVLSLYPLDKLASDAGLVDDNDNSAQKSEFSGVTIAHNTREKHQVDEVLELAEKAGGKIVKKAQEVFWGGYSGYFSDPDGHLWEVAWGAFPFYEDGSLELP